MDILYLLVPLSLVLVFLIGGVFWWTLRSGMFDDLEGPAWRILQDDDNPAPEGAQDLRHPRDPQDPAGSHGKGSAS